MGSKFRQTSYTFVGTQRVAVANSSAVLSAQTANNVEMIRMVGNADFWMASGSSAVTAQSSVAQTTSTFHPADVVEYFNTQDRFFSVITEISTAAFVNITEITQ